MISTSLVALKDDVAKIWRDSGRLESTVTLYLFWGVKFDAYCEELKLSPVANLTHCGAVDFLQSYSQLRKIESKHCKASGLSALRAWAFALQALGVSISEWNPSAPPAVPPSALLSKYEGYRRRHQGVRGATIERDRGGLLAFLNHLDDISVGISDVEIPVVDQFIVGLSSRLSRRTIARECTSLRSFFRFLHVTGTISIDLAASVKAPVVRSRERPARAIPWAEVQAILRAIDRTTRIGRRDYALLLMMAVYGMGAAEVLSLRLKDVDWIQGIIRIKRPKTGAALSLPLIPPVGEALTAYLQAGRPRHVSTREIFLSVRLPHGRLSASAICHRLRGYARAAGVSPQFLGSHVLRHSHASFQVDNEVPLQVIGDILGHRGTGSTSAYVSVAMERLRALSLPVPR